MSGHGAPRRRGVLVAALLVALGSGIRASADVLPLANGSSLVVETVDVVGVRASHLPRLPGRDATALGFRLLDGSATVVSAGIIPGTALPGGLPFESALGQSPLTEEVFLLVAPRSGVGSALRLLRWEGAGFGSPLPLQAEGPVGGSPALAFSRQGDALLAWNVGSAAERVLVKHVELSAAGEGPVWSFAALTDPDVYLRSAAVEASRLPAGVAHVAMDDDAQVAYLFVSDPEAGRLGVVAVSVVALDEIWGGSAPAVPVTLTPAGELDPLGEPGDDPLQPGPGGDAPVSWVVEFEHVSFQSFDVVFWVEGDTLRVLGFGEGWTSRLLSVDRPDSANADELAALRALWHELGRGSSSPGLLDRRGRVTRR